MTCSRKAALCSHKCMGNRKKAASIVHVLKIDERKKVNGFAFLVHFPGVRHNLRL